MTEDVLDRIERLKRRVNLVKSAEENLRADEEFDKRFNAAAGPVMHIKSHPWGRTPCRPGADEQAEQAHRFEFQRLAGAR